MSSSKYCNTNTGETNTSTQTYQQHNWQSDGYGSLCILRPLFVLRCELFYTVPFSYEHEMQQPSCWQSRSPVLNAISGLFVLFLEKEA